MVSSLRRDLDQSLFFTVGQQTDDAAGPQAAGDEAALRALETLVLRHPRAVELAARLGPFLDDGRVRFETGAPGIGIVIATPGGRRVLG